MKKKDKNLSIKSDAERAIKVTPIIREMKTSYLDYAMSVIIARALPDVRDGLKPVHRRILYAMKENGFEYGKPFKKSARVVGDVMGKYHPHGDAAIYDAMVRLAQDFSMGLTLVDGQGNFGSMDGDDAAASRYTEARMSKAAGYMVEDLDKDTITWRPNYDESIKEPEVLPARFPNILVNGGGGIAVGMATNIPTHNLGELIDATCALIDNPDLSIDEIMKYVPAPDFPTGGIILGVSGTYNAFNTGRGSIIIRAKTHYEEIRTKQAIIVDEIPYQVNKKVMIEKIIDSVKDKQIEGISDIRDESSKDGVRVVIELKKDAIADVVLNQLFKYSQMQVSFGVNMLAINKGKPSLMNLKEILKAFIEFREEVVKNRTTYELNKSRNKAHILVGLSITVANIDEVINLIRNAKDPQEAKEKLIAQDWRADNMEALINLIDDPESKIINGTYKLSEIQAKAILELKLQKLTGLEQTELSDAIKQISESIKEYLSILENRTKLLTIMKDELFEVKEKFATPRKTEIVPAEFETDIEDLIAREDMVITTTNTGYIKRVALNTYRTQNRGGKGRVGMTTKEEDYITNIFVANTHTPLIFFSNKGIAYQLKVYRLPLATPQSAGEALINLFPLEQGEVISTVMPLPENEAEWENLYVMFATSKGTVRRNRLSDFLNIRQNGKIAMKFEEEGEELIAVQPCKENEDVFLTLKSGRCIRFKVNEVRVFQSRASTGIRGIKTEADDKVISMSIISHHDLDSETCQAYLKRSKAERRTELASLNNSENIIEDDSETDNDSEETVSTKILTDEEYESIKANEQFILTVTETGLGKRTSAYEYRITHRGGMGIANIKITNKTKSVVSSFPIKENENILLITDSGKMIRMGVKNIHIAGRQTLGVKLFTTTENEKVVSVAISESDEESKNNDSNDTEIDTITETENKTPYIEIKDEHVSKNESEIAENKTEDSLEETEVSQIDNKIKGQESIDKKEEQKVQKDLFDF